MVSIIFTHWDMNSERSLLARFSLRSLQNSLNTGCEIIVVDNGNNLEDSQFFLQEAHEKRIAQYLRFNENTHFGYARNQGMKLAHGDFISIVDNDLAYQDNWLEACLDALVLHPDKKLIASPIDYPTQVLKDKYTQGTLDVKGKTYRLSMRAGSNCFVMSHKTMEEMGPFQLHRIAGSYYADKLVRAGYLVAVTPSNMANDIGLRRGYNLSEEIEPFLTLTNQEKLKL